MIGISVETSKQTNQMPADKTQKHRRGLLERVSDLLNFHFVIYLKFQNLTNLKREKIRGYSREIPHLGVEFHIYLSLDGFAKL